MVWLKKCHDFDQEFRVMNSKKQRVTQKLHLYEKPTQIGGGYSHQYNLDISKVVYSTKIPSEI